MSDDFFGDLGKSISRATQNAVDKTSNFFESTKISSQITAEEKEIEKIYRKIGESVARKIESKEEPYAGKREFELVDEIHARLDKILELKQNLAGVKGMKICPNCQSLVESNAAFCPKCGAPMPVEEEQEPEKEDQNPDSPDEKDIKEEKTSPEKEDDVVDASFDTVEDLTSVTEDVMDAHFTTIDDRTGEETVSEQAAEAEFVVLEEQPESGKGTDSEASEKATPDQEKENSGQNEETSNKEKEVSGKKEEASDEKKEKQIESDETPSSK